MTSCETSTKTVRTTRHTLRLTEAEVIDILLRWARREHGLHDAKIEIEVSQQGECVTGVVFTQTEVLELDG